MTQIFGIMPIMAGRFALADMLLVVGMALVTTSLLMVYRKRRRRRSVNSLTPHEQIERLKQQRGMRGDLEQLMVEIEQLAKRLSAQLDAKSIQLEQVIKAADERIDQLKTWGQQTNESDRTEEPPWASSAIANSATPTVPQTAADEPLAKAVYALADQGLEPADIAKQLNELIGKVELILALRES